MRLQDIKNFKDLREYAKQKNGLSVKKTHPPHPHNYSPYQDVYLVYHYATPIAYVIGDEIYAPHYVKENFLSITTAKYSFYLCEIGHCVSMETFIHYVYEFLENVPQGRNHKFIERYKREFLLDENYEY